MVRSTSRTRAGRCGSEEQGGTVEYTFEGQEGERDKVGREGQIGKRDNVKERIREKE